MATKPRERDVRRMAAGIAHSDAHVGLTDAEVADLHSDTGRSRRSFARDRRIGYPGMHTMESYLFNCPNPMRIVAWAKAKAYRELREKSDADLIQSYLEELAYECGVESDDRRDTVTRGVSWLDRKASSERNASVDLRKAAHEEIFAERGITEERVFGRVLQ